MIVDLDYIATIKKALRRINAEDLDNIGFIMNGKPIVFSEEDLEAFKLMGLNNTDINSVIGFTPKED